MNATATTEKREAIKVWNTDRLMRIGKMDSIADYMEMLDNMSNAKINSEYYKTFEAVYNVDEGC